MKIGVVGAGKVGCALAVGLKNRGFEISGVFSRSTESFKELSGLLGIAEENSLSRVIKNSELIFITVPDTWIADAAENIAACVQPELITGKVFLHCSGALTSDTLYRLKCCGSHVGSLHPIQTFADKENGWKGLENIFFGYEGSDEAMNYAEKIVRAFNGNMLQIKKEDKPIYHSAACILSNYTVTLSYIAGYLFEKIGIDPDSGVKALVPLMKKTVNNIEEYGNVNALTGPVSRGDTGVIGEHLEALRRKAPDVVGVYNVLARMTVEISLKKGTIDAEIARRFYNLLDCGVEKNNGY